MTDEALMIGTIMLAANVREVRIPDEWLAALPAKTLLRYRDESTGMTVFRLALPDDASDGEGVDLPALVIGGGE